MKHYLIVLLLILVLPPSITSQTSSIYDIQYTTNPGNGTYPSPLAGQYVTTGGIVTAINYNNKNYFISSPAGGAWNGIFIYDDEYSPAIGDSIMIQGQVYEYNGFTEIKSLSSFSVVSSGNPLPPPAQVSTQTVNNEEAYESVFVVINNPTVSQAYNEWGEFKVNDGSGSCYISCGFIDLEDSGFPMVLNYPFESIKGVISYSYGGFRLHPREVTDIQSSPENFILSAGDLHIYLQEEFDLAIKLSILNQPGSCTAYILNLEYDAEIIEYIGFDIGNTLSQNGSIEDQSTQGNVSLGFTGDFNINGIMTLIKLNFFPVSPGYTNLNIFSSTLNGNPAEFTSSGSVSTTFNSLSIGDTLTVIQRPIQNIPAIVVVGDELQIVCVAPENTENWEVELIHNLISVPLGVSTANYNHDLQIWTLNVIIPQVELYELYSLKITASDNIYDVSKNAVQVLPVIKDHYYFAHLTDTHLPTHFFYEDPESAYDTSEMQDLREVINDINLLRPEFVLLTGDYINEGELEDFENRRNHTKAQRILSEFEVPVYLVAGNHDLGGWDATPPPQGTSRNEWWRFFGWKWLKYPVGEPYYTQDYSFDYGSVHFTGLEAYVNYDGYLYNIYGEESFIQSQLQWLENDLINASSSDARVVFYHMDFADQLNLGSLNIDMTLWGHIHRNSGNIYTTPWNLATAAVCDGNRAFRIINVNNGVLQPNETNYAGYSGENLSIDYFPSNSGTADSVIAIIQNQYDLDFHNGLIKFVMPGGYSEYSIQNGELLQVDASGNAAICYVKVNIPANDDISVTISTTTSSGLLEKQIETGLTLFRNYPNPFRLETTIQFMLSKPENIKLEIYDISGRLLNTILDKKAEAGYHRIFWNGKNKEGKAISGNIFYCRVVSERGFIDVIRLVKM